MRKQCARPTVVGCSEGSGLDFALSHALLAKTRALIGLRQFAQTRRLLGQVVSRLQLEADPWADQYVAISIARLQISLGDLARASDHLSLHPESHANPLHARGTRRLSSSGQAAQETLKQVLLWIDRTRASRVSMKQALTWVAVASSRSDSSTNRGANARRELPKYFGAGISTHRDGLSCTTRASQSHCHGRNASGRLRTILSRSEDEPLARAAGLDIPRTVRRTDALSPRELEVYELLDPGSNESRDRPKPLHQRGDDESACSPHPAETRGTITSRSGPSVAPESRPDDSGLDDAG